MSEFCCPTEPISTCPTGWRWRGRGRSAAVVGHVRGGGAREVGRKRDIARHRAVMHRRIDADDPSHDGVVSRIDVRDLARDDVLSLRLWNPYFGLQTPQLDDPRQRLAGLNPLAFIERQLRQNPGDPRRYLPRPHPLPSALDDVRETRALLAPRALLCADLR